MDTTTLDQLILQNLDDLDAAAKRIEKINDRVWREAAAAVEAWAEAKGWQSEANDDEAWVASPDWCDGDDPYGWFSLDWGPNDYNSGADSEPHFSLSRLAGAAGGRLCLWFETKGVGVRAWKPIALANDTAIRDAGFSLTDKLSAYMDCTLSSQVLAEGLADDDLDEALVPITQALNRAYAARKLFGRMLTTARSA